MPEGKRTRKRSKAVAFGVAIALITGGVAVAAPAISSDDTADVAASEVHAAAADHAQLVQDLVSEYTGLLDTWTDCVATNAAQRGDTQSDPETRVDGPFDPEEACDDKPVLLVPDTTGESTEEEVGALDAGEADGPPAVVVAFLAELEEWVGCIQDGASAHADQQSNEEARVEDDEYDDVDKFQLCGEKPINPNDEVGDDDIEAAEDDGDRGRPDDAGKPEDAGPPADGGKPADAGPPADAGR